MAKVLVKLRRGHPRGVMRGRLADGVTVVEVTRDGVELEQGQISREMERSGWFEVEAVSEQPAPKPKAKAEAKAKAEPKAEEQ